MRFLAALALLLLAAPGALAQDRYSEPRECETPTYYAPVCLTDRVWTAAEAERLLGARDEVAFSQGDTLNVIARQAHGPVYLCCTIETALTRIEGSDLWVLSAHVLDLDRAVIDIQLSPPAKTLTAYYGANVPKPATVERLLGTLVEETIPSAALGEQRRLTIYLPPGYDKSQHYGVVYMADGSVLPAYAPAIEAGIIAGRSRPLIVVGIWPGQGDPAARAREYLVGHSFGRYRHHNQFVIDEVMPFVEGKYGASAQKDDRMLAGFSDGAAWALSTGLRHPDLFGSVAAFSLGWVPAADGIGSDGRPRLYLAAGVLEPDFGRTTARAARRAEGSDAPVRFEEFGSGHTLVAWQTMLLDALAWGFPRR
ncbi:MAG TPA: alpha/beta hydrolase-fold protein [Rhizomicrobium sp.]|jgi:enterochelin esterase-like enzyme|nr:alpha/beta hydrolase-fold protein [Rhizomicrobium sp.]